jgi:hypothetical protein
LTEDGRAAQMQAKPHNRRRRCRLLDAHSCPEDGSRPRQSAYAAGLARVGR